MGGGGPGVGQGCWAEGCDRGTVGTKPTELWGQGSDGTRLGEKPQHRTRRLLEPVPTHGGWTFRARERAGPGRRGPGVSGCVTDSGVWARLTALQTLSHLPHCCGFGYRTPLPAPPVFSVEGDAGVASDQPRSASRPHGPTSCPILACLRRGRCTVGVLIPFAERDRGRLFPVGPSPRERFRGTPGVSCCWCCLLLYAVFKARPNRKGTGKDGCLQKRFATGSWGQRGPAALTSFLLR